jgi:CHASE3 domain sensor protein
VALGLHKSFMILAPGSSLRRRVAYSLAIVRLVLVPVIFLAVYYLFKMGLIVDQIVNLDAPVTTLAEQISVQMSDARRSERSYLLLRDAQYLKANQEALAQVQQIAREIGSRASSEQGLTATVLENVTLYQQQLGNAVSLAREPGGTAVERVQQVVQAYEKDLDDLLKQGRRRTRAQLIDNLRNQVGSFDSQITSTMEAGDPVLRQVAPALQTSSEKILQVAGELEARSWARVQQDHQEARHLLYRAEGVLSIVSGLTLLLSVWISFVLPRQVVKPLQELKEAVDHAASGNYLIDFELRGQGEVVELAKSVRRLIAHMQEAV